MVGRTDRVTLRAASEVFGIFRGTCRSFVRLRPRRLTVFGEWCWIAIVAARGRSRLGISFLEMKFRKSSGSPDGHVWGGAPDSHGCGCSLEVARRIIMFAVAHLRLPTG